MSHPGAPGFTILNLSEINGRIQPFLWGKHSKWIGGYFLFLLPQKAFFCLALLFALPVLKPEASLKASEIKSLSLGFLSFHLTWSLVFQVLSQVAEEEEEPLPVKICWVLLASGLLVCIFSCNHLVLCKATQQIMRERLPHLSVDKAWGYIWPLGLLLPDFPHYAY